MVEMIRDNGTGLMDKIKKIYEGKKILIVKSVVNDNGNGLLLKAKYQVKDTNTYGIVLGYSINEIERMLQKTANEEPLF